MEICSMYGIFTYIYPKNHPNVGKYSIHGASGYGNIYSGKDTWPYGPACDMASVRKATSQLATYALTIFIMFLP